jgi:cyanophycin synthetase
MNPAVEAAVFENGFDALLNEGLAYDSCDIGVITNVNPDHHFNDHGIETLKQVFTVFRTQIDIVTPTAAAVDDVEKNVKLPIGAAILNAKDEMLIEISELCHGEVIFFSINPDLPIITRHRTNGTGPTQGRRTVILRDNWIILVTGSDEFPLLNLIEISSSNIGPHSTQAIENILAAIATAWALGIEPDLMRTGIKNFGFNQEKYKSGNQNFPIGLQT